MLNCFYFKIVSRINPLDDAYPEHGHLCGASIYNSVVDVIADEPQRNFPQVLSLWIKMTAVEIVVVPVPGAYPRMPGQINTAGTG